MIPCVYKYFFNIECPGCGVQRSFWSLMELNLIESFKYFPALIPLGIYLILEILMLFKIELFVHKNWSKYFGIGVIIIQVITYILRLLDIIPWTCELDQTC